MKIKINNDQFWKLGDIIVRKNDPETIAMIVQDDDEQYCAMDISPNHVGTYSTNPSKINAGCCSSIDNFKKEFQDCWRKVNAELNIKL